jgi:hypothetical protein
MGCGKENIYGSFITPGWKLKQDDIIEKDVRGFDKISLKRNNERLLQTSLYFLQAWRSVFYCMTVIQNIQIQK